MGGWRDVSLDIDGGWNDVCLDIDGWEERCMIGYRMGVYLTIDMWVGGEMYDWIQMDEGCVDKCMFGYRWVGGMMYGWI